MGDFFPREGESVAGVWVERENRDLRGGLERQEASGKGVHTHRMGKRMQFHN